MFDSGVGGLTVMREVVRVLPHESIIYFGDTARLPYGDKSPETIIRYSLENAAFLVEHQIKLLVVPCNTATAFALDELRKVYSIPVIGVIEPGAQKAARATRNKRIAVLATRGTINSTAYQRAIHNQLPGADIVPIACPLFVPMVEERMIHHPATKLIVKDYLHHLRERPVDTVLLGCTHYPLIRGLIQEEVGDDVVIVDSATTCAEEIIRVLDSQGLRAAPSSQPTYHFFVSDDPTKFKSLGEEFLGLSIDHVSIPG